MTLITCKIYRYTIKNIKIIFDVPKLEDSQSNRLGINKFILTWNSYKIYRWI